MLVVITLCAMAALTGGGFVVKCIVVAWWPWGLVATCLIGGALVVSWVAYVTDAANKTHGQPRKSDDA